MNAKQINDALAGVPAKYLDPHLTYTENHAPKGWYDGDCYIATSHAMKIQCESMAEGLIHRAPYGVWIQINTNRRGKVVAYVVHIPQIVPGSIASPVRTDRFSFTAPTRIEALAAACRALEAQ